MILLGPLQITLRLQRGHLCIMLIIYPFWTAAFVIYVPTSYSHLHITIFDDLCRVYCAFLIIPSSLINCLIFSY